MSYATLAEVRALDGLEDVTVFPDADLTEGITFAAELITDYCGPWEPTSEVITFAGLAGYIFDLQVEGCTALTALTVDGVDALAGSTLTYDGILTSSVTATAAQTVVATVTRSYQAVAPVRLKWAARTIARQYVLELKSRTPDRALSVQSEYGQIILAQAGGNGRPTSMPDVNAVLNRYRIPGMA